MDIAQTDIEGPLPMTIRARHATEDTLARYYFTSDVAEEITSYAHDFVNRHVNWNFFYLMKSQGVAAKGEKVSGSLWNPVDAYLAPVAIKDHEADSAMRNWCENMLQLDIPAKVNLVMSRRSQESDSVWESQAKRFKSSQLDVNLGS